MKMTVFTSVYRSVHPGIWRMVWDDFTHTYYIQSSWSITVVIWSFTILRYSCTVFAFISCGGSQPVDRPSASSDIYHHLVLTQEHFPRQHNVWTTLRRKTITRSGLRDIRREQVPHCLCQLFVSYASAGVCWRSAATTEEIWSWSQQGADVVRRSLTYWLLLSCVCLYTATVVLWYYWCRCIDVLMSIKFVMWINMSSCLMICKVANLHNNTLSMRCLM